MHTSIGYTLHERRYVLLREDRVDLVDAYTTDPELRDTTQQFFVALRDDQNFFPRCCAATMATHHVLDAFSHVRLREALERLTGKVTKTTSPP